MITVHFDEVPFTLKKPLGNPGGFAYRFIQFGPELTLFRPFQFIVSFI